jgi:hypothetical protein
LKNFGEVSLKVQSFLLRAKKNSITYEIKKAFSLSYKNFKTSQSFTYKNLKKHQSDTHKWSIFEDHMYFEQGSDVVPKYL